MKRLIVGLMLVALISGIGVAAFAVTTPPPTANQAVTVTWSAESWISLWIPDRAIDLGTIDGPWDKLTDGGGPRFMRVRTNHPDGFTLQITAELVAHPGNHPNPGGILARLTLTSADMEFDDASLNVALTFTGAQGQFDANDIRFEFDPNYDDIPGTYSVTVTFTVTAG